MAGCRMIDESICRDKRLNAVSEGAENLFYRLLVKSDDVGNNIGEPDLVKGQIYPRREISEVDIKIRLLELHNAKNGNGLGLIDLYGCDGEIFVHFPNFKKYQKLRKDINPKISFPVRTCDNSFRTCDDPFTQVREVSKKESKYIKDFSYLSKENLKNLKNIFKDEKALRKHCLMLGFSEEEITGALV